MQKILRPHALPDGCFPTLTSSPQLKPWDSHSHKREFLLRQDLPGVVFTPPALTASPQAETVSPTAKMFFTDRLVFTDQSCREFVQEITASISDTGMNTIYALSGFLPVLRAFALSRVVSLSTCQAF